MTDLSPTITSKSDQLNADDLIGGPRTVVVTKVTSGSPDQPINIYYEGDQGKPWRPCKSMRRVLVAVWGPQGADYVGRAMTLFCDPSVKFGGIAVGGVRISHMSNIDSDTVLMLTETRGKKAPCKIRRLVAKEKPKRPDLSIVVKAIEEGADQEKVAEAHTRAMRYEWDKYETAKIDAAKVNGLSKFKKEEANG